MDFILHCGCSLILFFVFYFLVIMQKTRAESPNVQEYGEVMVIATALTMLTGVGKEIYDFFDYGLFSSSDLLYDWVGASVGMFIMLAFTFLYLGVDFDE